MTIKSRLVGIGLASALTCVSGAAMADSALVVYRHAQTGAALVFLNWNMISDSANKLDGQIMYIFFEDMFASPDEPGLAAHQGVGTSDHQTDTKRIEIDHSDNCRLTFTQAGDGYILRVTTDGFDGQCPVDVQRYVGRYSPKW